MSFVLPDDWADNSVVAYTAPRRTREANPPSVVITRDRLAPRETLQEYVRRQRKDLSRDLPGYRSIAERTLEIDGVQAFDHTYAWRGRGGMLEQRQTMVVRGGVVVTITTTVVRSEAPQLAPVFQRLFASVKFPGGHG